MSNFEIVSTDEDVQSTILQMSEDTAFVIQTDTKGVKQYVILHQSEARQMIAGLTAFLEGKLVHMSDCALHSSPAYPIEACDCAHP
jgi:hypothetical protein